MKITPVVAILSVSLLTGCVSTTPTAMTGSRALASEGWQGTWTATNESYYGHNSIQALVLEPGGKGAAITSSIFNTRQGSYWVTQTPLSWQIISSSQVNVTLSDPQTVSGDGSWGWFAKKSATFPLYSTVSGLRLDALGLSKASFKRQSDKPDPAMTAKVTNDVQQRHRDLQGADSGRGMSSSQGAGLFLAGASLGAAVSGDLQTGKNLMNQATATYSGLPVTMVPQIGSYDPNTYFAGGKGKANEVMGKVVGTDAQLREAYPDGQAWDVRALNGTIWKIYYGASTSIKDQMIANGNLVTPSGFDGRNGVIRGPYKPTSNMKIGLEAINP